MNEQRANVRKIRIEERADEGAHLQGYGAVFYDGTPDTQFEIFSDFIERIMPGAFDRALREDDVRGLFNHNVDHVLGRTSAETLKLSVDKIGLRYDIALGETSIATDVRSHVARGEVTGSSFSFQITDQEFRTENGVDIREIRGVEMFDVGPVTFPAYDATTAGVRSAADYKGTSPAINEAVAALGAWHLERAGEWALAAAATARQQGRLRRLRAVEVQERSRGL